jgi:uncharacterized protein (DUF736 family)
MKKNIQIWSIILLTILWVGGYIGVYIGTNFLLGRTSVREKIIYVNVDLNEKMEKCRKANGDFKIGYGWIDDCNPGEICLSCKLPDNFLFKYVLTQDNN